MANTETTKKRWRKRGTGKTKIKCFGCGKEFIEFKCYASGRKFCSKACRHKSLTTICHCIVCNKEFEVDNSQIKRGGGKFCSFKCHGIWISKNLKENKALAWSGGKIKAKCKECGKEFKAWKSLNRKYCGKKCRNNGYKKNPPNNPLGKKHSTETRKKMSDLRKKNPNYYWLGKKRPELQGENNPMKNPQIRQKVTNTRKEHYDKIGRKTSIVIRIHQSIKYQEWRQQIFIRDNFTCQKCKQKGGEIHAHHKKPFAKLLDEIKLNLPLYPLYEGAMIYIPLWDLDNGITLCNKCHRKTSSYGTKKAKRHLYKVRRALQNGKTRKENT